MGYKQIIFKLKFNFIMIFYINSMFVLFTIYTLSLPSLSHFQRKTNNLRMRLDMFDMFGSFYEESSCHPKTTLAISTNNLAS